MRKKKNTLFEEQSDEFVFFLKREAEQEQSKADIQRRKKTVLRHILRAIIIYSGESKSMKAVVQALSSSIQAMGHEVKQVNVEKSSRAESLFLYDLVYVGSPVLGSWGGKFSEPLASYLKKCSGLEGKKVAVFVIPKLLGVSKALKRIMKLLEEKGSIIIAFQSIKKLSEARDFGKRLSKAR